MKTIKERAKEYSLKDFDGYYTGWEKAVEEGYIAGAKEQKGIDDASLQERFEKALRYLELALQCGVHPCSKESFIMGFKKVIEE